MDTTGTVEAVAPGFLIQIKSVAGQPYLLQLTQNSQVQVKGTAKADVLGPGSFISFVAEVDKRRSQVQDKIAKLTLFTPSPQRPLGAFPGQKDAEGPLSPDPFDVKGASEAKPKARAPTGRAPTEGWSRSVVGRSRQHKDEDEGPPVETFEIVGQITGIDKTGKLIVHAPNPYFKPAVEIELGDDPEIELDVAGLALYTLAKPGDKVQVRGRALEPQMGLDQMGQNVVQVMDLTIELAEPLSTVQAEQPKKKPARKTSRSSRRKRGEAEEPEAAEQPVEPKDEKQPKKKDE